MNNFAHLTEILSDRRKIDIFSTSETHINGSYQVDGYNFLSKSLKNGKGGGVAFFISDRLEWIRRCDLENDEIEGIWIEVFPMKSKSILISGMYRSPDSSSYLPEKFINLPSSQLSRVTKSNKEEIIMRDLNVNHNIIYPVWLYSINKTSNTRYR